jgi:hypothetical protein
MTQAESQKQREHGLSLIYCPNCKTHPVVPRFFDISLWSGDGRVVYDCRQCGYETTQTFEARA